ncbi:MAG TPA: pyridine nucleotide-disulfide oxidoreductase [Desulfobacteraceae bacterium]|nr:pyridine nucleotide-disulfide oxidoreductase [Desulfobacteraceae bacterium]
MSRHLILVGGGHAHMVTLEAIHDFTDKGFEVTVIAPADYHYYSGMGPGMLGGTYAPDDIRFATKNVVTSQGGIFLRDKVVRIDPDLRRVVTETGRELTYDVISFNAGSYVPVPAAGEDGSTPDNLYTVKPIERLMAASKRLTDLFRQKDAVVSIVGGGPSGVEVAGNVWQLAKRTGPYTPKIRIFAGKGLMHRFDPRVKRRVRHTLEHRGMDIRETGYVKEVFQDHIRMNSGEQFPTDFTFMALGVTPSPIFTASGLPIGPDGGLLVNEFLQCPEHPEIFGGGDCIHFNPKSLDKVGVYAVRQNPILCHNLMAALEKPGAGNAFKSFDPGPDYLLIFNLGGGMGVLKKHGIVFGGRLAFKIKDYIDRRFIRRFQAIERTL